MPSPVEEFVVSVTPQSPEEFAAMRKRQERQARIENSETGFSENQQNLEYFGGGPVGLFNAAISATMGAAQVAPPVQAYNFAQNVIGTGKSISESVSNAVENGITGAKVEPPDLPEMGKRQFGGMYDALMAYTLGYGVLNTTVSTGTQLLNAPAIAAGISEPGENYKLWKLGAGIYAGGLGNLGGNELNPFLNDMPSIQEGLRWDDVTSIIQDTYNNNWDNDITIGQTGMWTVGRTAHQPFWDEEGDAAIIQESIEHMNDPKNERGLYSANIGLHSDFDITDELMISSSTDQSWGRWISGGLDAAVAWWAAPEVFAAKVAGKGIKKATTVFMNSMADRTQARAQYQAGKLYAETGGSEGKPTALYDLAVQISKMPKHLLAKHDIVKLADGGPLVADILGAAKTPDDAFDALMALGGDQVAIANIRASLAAKRVNMNGKEVTLLDALTQAARRNEEMRQELTDAVKKKQNIGGVFTPIFDRQIKQMEAKIEELQGVMDEIAVDQDFFVKLSRAVDVRTGTTMGNARIRQLTGVKGGSAPTGRFWDKSMDEMFPAFDGRNKVAKMGVKAEKRYRQVTGESVWTDTAIKAGGKWGRTVRLIHSGFDYMKTQKIRGIARTYDANDSLIEMTNALSTNPLLRRLTRTMSTRVASRLDDAPVDEYMPTAQAKIAAKQEDMTDEAWEEFVASGEFSAWADSQKLRTATQFRSYYYDRMLSARNETERARIFDEYEEQMLTEMAESYGMDAKSAKVVLDNFNRMKNRIAKQIEERGWYWDKSSDEIVATPQLQSELSSGKPLLDFAFMDRVFKINSGGLKGAKSTVGLSVTAVLNTIDGIWRPLVLMRLGYTVRNVTESNLRELAYTNSLLGNFKATGKAYSKKNDLKWVELGANAGDRLSRVGRTLWYSPLHPSIPGTMRALRKSLDDEQSLMARRHEMIREIKEDIARYKAERKAKVEEAQRKASIKVAREVAKSRGPGESVVWRQMEGYIQDRERFFATVDEIILDPGETLNLEQAGWGAGLFAEDVSTQTMLRGVRPMDELDSPVYSRRWDEQWLTEEEKAIMYESPDPNVRLWRVAEMQYTALSRWLDETRGTKGQVVRIIDADKGHFEVIHNPRKWFQDEVTKTGRTDVTERALRQIRIVPKESIDSIQAGRVQVGGGVLDLRPASMGDQWSAVSMDPSVNWTDTWSRMFRFSEIFADDPRNAYPKLGNLTDPVGGEGKFREAMGFIPFRMVRDLVNPDFKTFEWADEAAAEWTTPIVLHGYGRPHRMQVVVGDGDKRLAAMGTAQMRDRNIEDIPVTIRWMGNEEPPSGVRVMSTSIDEGTGRLGYLDDPAVDEIAEVQRLGGEYFHPNNFTQFHRGNPADVLYKRMLSMGVDPSEPTWKPIFEAFERIFPGRAPQSIAFMIETARIARAAEMSPTIAKQVGIRLSGVTDPGAIKYLREEGHLMGDEQFMQMVDEYAPFDPTDAYAEINEALRVVDAYKGTTYSRINGSLYDGRVDDPRLIPMIASLDYITQNTHEVSNAGPMKVFRRSDHDLRDGRVPAFLSVSENPDGVPVSGSEYHYGMVLDPGVPYFSFTRSIDNGTEQEHILPRGLKVTRIEDEYQPALGKTLPMWRATWDPDEAEQAIMEVAPAFNVISPIGYGGKHSYLIGEQRVGPQLGGYTYGEQSGQWTAALMGNQKYYVKDYPDPVQGFLEYFFDNQSLKMNTRQSQMMWIPEQRRYVYASRMTSMNDMKMVGDGSDLTSTEIAGLKLHLPGSVAEDTLWMNFDGIGPAGENMWFRIDDGASTPVPHKLDNGAIGPYRAHGEPAPFKDAQLPWDSIINFRDQNGLEPLLRRMYPDQENASAEFRAAVAHHIVDEIQRSLSYGGPGNMLRNFYKQFKEASPREHSFGLMDDQIDQLADMYSERAKSLLMQIIEWRKSTGGNPDRDERLLNRLLDTLDAGKRDASREAVPANPGSIFPVDARPPSAIIRNVDRPDEITEQLMADLLRDYAARNGYGKIITPNPSKNRGYQVQVIGDSVYNGGDNVDGTYPGFLSAAADVQDSVLNLSRMTPQQIASRGLGLDLNFTVRNMNDLDQVPDDVRKKIAIMMGREGYDYVVLPGGKKLSHSELLGDDAVGAEYGSALAKDKVDEHAQAILAKDEGYAELDIKVQEAESKVRSIKGRMDKREADIAKIKKAMDLKRSKRQKEGGTTFSGAMLPEYIPYMAFRNGKWVQDEVEVESALGPQASLYRQLISSNDRVAADMMGLGEMTFRGMRTTRAETELQPYTHQYWQGLADYGNKRLNNDPITEGIMEGLTDDQIIQRMFSTARGRSVIRNLEDFKAFRPYVDKEVLGEGMRDQFKAIIQDRRSIIDEYFNDSTLQEIMIDEKKLLTADIMRDRLGGTAGMKPFIGHSVEYERALHRRAIASVMHVLGTMPEDKLARSPFFRNRYREYMQEQVEIKAQQGQTEFGVDELMQMSRIARREALQTLNNTLYTIQRVSTFADSVRLLFPFFPAWASAARFWMYQIPKEKPENLVRYMMVDSAPDRAGWSVDDDNKRVTAPYGTPFAMSRKLLNSETYSIAFQVADEDLGWFEKMVGPQSSLKFPKGSIDMMLQGEFPLIPTMAPLVSAPVTFIASLNPDILTRFNELGDFTLTLGDDEETIVTNGTIGKVISSRAIPFGTPTSEKEIADILTEMYAAPWIAKLITMQRGESSMRFVATASEIHRSRMTDWELNDKTGPAPRYADSVKEASEFQLFRAAINAGAPFSPQFQSKYQFYIDAWREIQAEGEVQGWSSDDREKMFIDMYGKEFFRYTKSKSSTMSGMAPDLGEYEAVTSYEGLTGDLASIGKDAKYMNMLTKVFNAGEGFNPNVYAWQMNRQIPGAAGRTFRGGTPERQLEIQSQIELGWYEYNKQSARIEAVATEKGYGQDVVDLAKSRLVDRMQLQPEYQDWYTEFQEISGGRWVDSVNALYRMLGDEDFMRDHGPPPVGKDWEADYANMTRQQQYVWTIQEFVRHRNIMISLLEKAKNEGGSGNIDAKQNRVLNIWMAGKLEELYALNTDFADMHRRFFGGDKYERTEDTAVTNE